MPEPVERISICVDESVEMESVDTDRLRRLTEIVLERESVAWSSISIVLAGHETVRNLNRKYLDHDFETDVLSFLIDQTGDGIDAEVYVDVQTAVERHVEFKVSLRQEIERYLIHGLLHLAGYEDDTPRKKRRMQECEDRYLTVTF
ncbi:MAG: rRNA maturation RNase YbeY [Bacteroidetes bacterium]|nr:rRNA maturation RNase YbeY [Bacteroidota bacterium]